MTCIVTMFSHSEYLNDFVQAKRHSESFLQIRNKQNPAIKSTIGKDDGSKQANFLVKDITNLKYSKIAVVNIQIKVNSSVNSGQARTMFKRFLLEQGNILQKIPS